MGRSLGILFRHPATKLRADSENLSAGRSGGAPSTMAWGWGVSTLAWVAKGGGAGGNLRRAG